MGLTSKRIVPRYLTTTSKGGRGRNFGLSPEEFAELREALKDGDNRLYERIFLQHFDDSLQYLRLNDKASHQAAYDAVMETMLRFRDLLVTDKLQYGNLRYLFTRMARQEYARACKRSNRFAELPPELLELAEEKIVFDQEEYSLLTRAFNTLAPACRELLRSFYFRRQTLKEIAVAEERGAPAVRKQKSRCVATLRQYFYLLSR